MHLTDRWQINDRGGGGDAPEDDNGVGGSAAAAVSERLTWQEALYLATAGGAQLTFSFAEPVPPHMTESGFAQRGAGAPRRRPGDPAPPGRGDGETRRLPGETDRRARRDTERRASSQGRRRDAPDIASLVRIESYRS